MQGTMPEVARPGHTDMANRLDMTESRSLTKTGAPTADETLSVGRYEPMNYQSLLAVTAHQPPTRAGLIGVGQFGLTLLAQSRAIALLELSVLCDVDVDRLRMSCLRLGWADDDIAIAETRRQAVSALEQGKLIITSNHEVVTSLPLDVTIEATGNAETGARTSTDAISNGQNLVLVTKETDAIVGPLLAHEAKRAGLCLSQVDGDQPALTLALISWARTLGLEIAAAGKASEYDFVLDVYGGVISAANTQLPVANPETLWAPAGVTYSELVLRRNEAFAALPTRTPPDFCEMCLIANASGLKPDISALHAPIARPVELADLLRNGDGGLFSRSGGCLDVFNCLRRPDEISFAGGVFIVIRNPDESTGNLFREKGIPVSSDGRHSLVYNPTHLLGVEAALSVIVAHRLGMSTGSDNIDTVTDVVARATIEMSAGERVPTFGFRKRIEGTEPALVDAAPMGSEGPVPYFALAGLKLKRNVKAGQIISAADVEVPSDSILFKRRYEQDALFLSEFQG